jgi:hypothetical protein
MHGLFSLPLQIFMSAVAPPDLASLRRLETDLDDLARSHELSDHEARTLKDSLVEPFRREGDPFGPDSVEWLMMLVRRLVALPPSVVTAGAQMQWTTLQLGRYASGLTVAQYVALVRSQLEQPAAASELAPKLAPAVAQEDDEPPASSAPRKVLPLRIRRKGMRRRFR